MINIDARLNSESKQLLRFKKNKTSLYLLEIIMLILAAFMLVPFYYIVVNTFKTMHESTFFPMALPKVFTLENYSSAINKMMFLNCFKNNIVITSVSIIFLVIFCSMASYPISRRRSRVNKFLKFYFLAGLMIPFQATIMPLYKIMQAFHFINSIHGIIILYISTSAAFNIFLYQGYLKTIPIEIEEAAIIDGCSVWRNFWGIIFPLLKPITATVIVYNAMGIWNDFLSPLLFLQSRRNATMVLEVQRNIGQFSTDWGPLMTMMVLTLLPVFIFFIFMQKYIIKGLTGGSIKG